MTGLDDLIVFYENLTLADAERFAEFYSHDAYFKDPFNEVRGVEPIQRIFRHMFKQLEAPHFHVAERVIDPRGDVVLVWELGYRTRLLGEQVMRGVTHLRFASDGKVIYHRDYWDASEELYAKVPLLGALMRLLKRSLAA